jgi:hypothetical protein
MLCSSIRELLVHTNHGSSQAQMRRQATLQLKFGQSKVQLRNLQCIFRMLVAAGESQIH